MLRASSDTSELHHWEDPPGRKRNLPYSKVVRETVNQESYFGGKFAITQSQACFCIKTTNQVVKGSLQITLWAVNHGSSTETNEEIATPVNFYHTVGGLRPWALCLPKSCLRLWKSPLMALAKSFCQNNYGRQSLTPEDSAVIWHFFTFRYIIKQT